MIPQLQLEPPHLQLVPPHLQLVPPHLQLVPWLKIRAAVRRLPHSSLSRSALLGTDNFYLLPHAISKANILHSFLAPVYLGAFAKLRKTTIGFVMSVRLSIRIEQPSSHWTDFPEIWYLRIFSKIWIKFQFN